jgi:hypothetical protein
MLEAAKPLLKWINEECHPHCTVIVRNDMVVLSEDVAVVPTAEFVKD